MDQGGSAVTEFTQFWMEQCSAAEEIRGRFGADKSIGYLVGEKCLNHLRAAGTQPRFAVETAGFAQRVREIFSRDDLHAYFDTVRRVGALGHVATDEEFQAFRDAGALGEDPVCGAEDVLLLDEAREWLLSD